MGASNSSLSDLDTNPYLLRLAGPDSIDVYDPFWNQLLSFSFHPPKCSGDNRVLEESTSSLCKQLTSNNLRTANLPTLLNIFFMRVTELKESLDTHDNVFVWQTYNALFIIRIISKYLVENVSEESLLRHFNALHSTPNSGGDEDGVCGVHGMSSKGRHKPVCLLEQFLGAVIEVVVDVPIVSYTYIIHLESINTLIIFLTSQIFQQQGNTSSIITTYLMHGRCSIHASLLMKRLFMSYMLMLKCPDYLVASNSSGGGSVVLGLAAGLWSALTLGKRPVERGVVEGDEGEVREMFRESPLSQQSVLLTLILINTHHHHHHRHESDTESDTSHNSHSHNINPYRQALAACTDAMERSDLSSPTEAVCTFRIDYSVLYDTLCSTVSSDSSTLLLYFLLHQNIHVKNYMLARTDTEKLVLPLLQLLYGAHDRNSHQVYMALIIILILSEDQLFNNTIHDVGVSDVGWYKERHIPDITLGGLLVLIVVRTMQYNIRRVRDKYLHTNCLAALANMSADFKNLHPYVCQRLVSLFELLSKKHVKLSQQMAAGTLVVDMSESEVDADATSLDIDSTADQVYDLSILEEVMRMVLEILNSTLTHGLHTNPHLVYTLLHQRHLFEAYLTHHAFQDILHNITTVISHFSSKLKECPDRHPSPDTVLDIIKQAAFHWPTDRLRKFPDLKFRYVEDQEPEEFFVPYVWSLVHGASRLYWHPSITQLFQPTSF